MVYEVYGLNNNNYFLFPDFPSATFRIPEIVCSPFQLTLHVSECLGFRDRKYGESEMGSQQIISTRTWVSDFPYSNYWDSEIADTANNPNKNWNFSFSIPDFENRVSDIRFPNFRYATFWILSISRVIYKLKFINIIN